MEREKRYALLIDAENAEIKYLDSILDELKNYGNITYKRMYGDFTSSGMREWNHKALEYAIVAIQQPHYSKYKNAADIMLVIDAMDILYAQNVDGFCIVSNDSDYTRLVNRLCEAGMEVIGMGSSNASRTLKAACTEFKNLEKIFSDVSEEKEREKGKASASEEKDTITGIDVIRNAIAELVQKNERAGLGGIKSTLQRKYSDFDERNYGFTNIRKLIESMKDFEIIQENSSLYVVMASPKYEEKDVTAYILSELAAGEVEMGVLSNHLHDKFDNFTPKNYGYSQLSKFISGISGVKVKRRGNGSFVSLQSGKEDAEEEKSEKTAVADASVTETFQTESDPEQDKETSESEDLGDAGDTAVTNEKVGADDGVVTGKAAGDAENAGVSETDKPAEGTDTSETADVAAAAEADEKAETPAAKPEKKTRKTRKVALRNVAKSSRTAKKDTSEETPAE